MRFVKCIFSSSVGSGQCLCIIVTNLNKFFFFVTNLNKLGAYNNSHKSKQVFFFLFTNLNKIGAHNSHKSKQVRRTYKMEKENKFILWK